MPPRIHIQPRDLDILQSLATGRYLTAEALAWLHFPTWRQRYRAQRAQTDELRAWKPSSTVYDRLRLLRNEGWLDRLARSVDLARQSFARLQDIYLLTQAGAELVADMRDVPIESLYWDSSRKRSIQNVEHSVAIGMLYAALRCALAYHGKELVDWQGDHRLRDPATYDRIAVPGQRLPLPVQPDATFLLDGQRYFVEVDRNSPARLSTWLEKAQAYHAYRGSPALRARYQADDFVLLVVAPTPLRVQRIAEQLVKVTQAADPRALLLESREVHPTCIRGNWQQIAAVDETRQRVVSRLVTVYQPRLSPTALWAAPP